MSLSFSEGSCTDCQELAALPDCSAAYCAVLLTLSRVAASRTFSPLAKCSRARCNLPAVTTGLRQPGVVVSMAPSANGSRRFALPARLSSRSGAAGSARVDPVAVAQVGHRVSQAGALGLGSGSRVLENALAARLGKRRLIHFSAF